MSEKDFSTTAFEICSEGLELSLYNGETDGITLSECSIEGVHPQEWIVEAGWFQSIEDDVVEDRKMFTGLELMNIFDI